MPIMKEPHRPSKACPRRIRFTLIVYGKLAVNMVMTSPTSMPNVVTMRSFLRPYRSDRAPRYGVVIADNKPEITLTQSVKCGENRTIQVYHLSIMLAIRLSSSTLISSISPGSATGQWVGACRIRFLVPAMHNSRRGCRPPPERFVRSCTPGGCGLPDEQHPAAWVPLENRALPGGFGGFSSLHRAIAASAKM
ncbi:hypothetical protein BU16DRAFT_144832 [Lophium mytilinum]|uniref:Uncharacterized protein n=1 Tax=Lophium mytilinum TaxID=390894 RepID=A0A6A6QFH8_9PEZI|nr:hypothetical protein BU16DRAFT_144832 [Lophium mytilinum]